MKHTRVARATATASPPTPGPPRIRPDARAGAAGTGREDRRCLGQPCAVSGFSRRWSRAAPDMAQFPSALWRGWQQATASPHLGDRGSRCSARGFLYRAGGDACIRQPRACQGAAAERVPRGQGPAAGQRSGGSARLHRGGRAAGLVRIKPACGSPRPGDPQSSHPGTPALPDACSAGRRIGVPCRPHHHAYPAAQDDRRRPAAATQNAAPFPTPPA